jgi:hypothetical protein
MPIVDAEVMIKIVVAVFLTSTAVQAGEPFSKDNLQGKWPSGFTGLKPETFTKDHDTKQCGKKYCWAPSQPTERFQGERSNIAS